MPVSTERKKVTDLPAAAALTPAMMLYIVDPAEAAVINQSKRASIALFDARYVGIAGAVTSVFGRIGAVVAVAGDYLASQVTNVPAGGIAAVTVQAAIDELDTEKQPADAFLSSIALLGTAADRMIYITGIDTAAETALTAYARTLLDDPNDVTARATLNLGSMAVINDAAADGSYYARQNNAWAAVTGAALLPVDDDVALVYRTGFPARTVTLDATALTAARVVTLPDADFQPAGLALANVFTAAQMVDGSADAVQLTVQGNAAQTNSVFVVETSAGDDIFEVSNDYKLSVRDSQILYVPDQTNFTGTLIFGDGGGSLSHLLGDDGQHNLGVGFGTLVDLTTGYRNFAMGTRAGTSLTTGSSNVFIGYEAGRYVTIGEKNMAIGSFALGFCTTGINNTAVGDRALLSLVTNSGNTAIGFDALRNTLSNDNTAIGAQALRTNVTGIENTAVGGNALHFNTGKQNVGIGRMAGRYQGTGNYNIFIGVDAGKGSAAYNASGNILIGFQAGYNETTSNKLYIANSNTATPLIYGQFDTGLLKFHTVDAATNTAPNTVSLVHLTSGAPAVNFGVSLRFGLESTTTEDQNAGRIAALWNDPIHAQRKADLVAYASDFNAEREIWRGRADGTNPLFAVLGQTPAARQAHIADPAGGGTQDAEARTAINSILATLETFGFLETV